MEQVIEHLRGKLAEQQKQQRDAMFKNVDAPQVALLNYHRVDAVMEFIAQEIEHWSKAVTPPKE